MRTRPFPGAMIASLSIPWGEVKGDEELGGYHLVWTRDMVNSATGLLAAGDDTTAMRALIYLACSQQPDGGFPQNFWIDGDRLLARHPARRSRVSDHARVAAASDSARLGNFDPYPMVTAAARYLMRQGPGHAAGALGREHRLLALDAGGNIAALICAAELARDRGDAISARYLEEYADFLECHLEEWTVTNQGTLVPGYQAPLRPHQPGRSQQAASPTKIPITEPCWSRIGRPARRRNFPPRKSSTADSWSWCATESATPAIL